MTATGRVNPQFRLEDQGLEDLGRVHYNLLEPALVEAALARDEGHLGLGGCLMVTTGKHTGRSPKDKFVVRTPSVDDSIWWENNPPMSPEALRPLVRRHARAHEGPRLLRAGSLCRRRPGTSASTCGS